jgi:hypothetical protein
MKKINHALESLVITLFSHGEERVDDLLNSGYVGVSLRQCISTNAARLPIASQTHPVVLRRPPSLPQAVKRVLLNFYIFG